MGFQLDHPKPPPPTHNLLKGLHIMGFHYNDYMHWVATLNPSLHAMSMSLTFPSLDNYPNGGHWVLRLGLTTS